MLENTLQGIFWAGLGFLVATTWIRTSKLKKDVKRLEKDVEEYKKL